MPQLNIWSRERNTAMKVFSQLYVGLRSQPKAVDLGFATPYEKNAAGRKREETVDRWADSGYYDMEKRSHVKRDPRIKIIENKPAPGFKITDDVKRVYWGGGNVVWRVEDPRGFELEIQSNNLMALIQSCGVEEGGLIPGNCVWGRSGKDNILLHETSDEYKDAVKAAETLKAPKQVGKASRQIGNVYRRVDGSLGLYLGTVHVIKMGYGENNDHENVRVDLTNGLAMQVSASTYSIGASEVYEAVQDVEQGPNDGIVQTAQVKLYKKAPLIDDTGHSIVITVDNSYLMGTNWAFASSAISCKRIVSVTVNPILNPEFCLVSLPKHLFDKKMSDLKMYSKHGGTYPPVGRILPWQEDEAIMFGDTLCCHIGTIGEAYEHRAKEQTEPTYYIGLPLLLQGNQITYHTMPHHHWNPLVKQDHAWSGYETRRRRDALAQCTPLPFAKLPTISNNAELLKYAQHLYDNRAMFYITAREATK